MSGGCGCGHAKARVMKAIGRDKVPDWMHFEYLMKGEDDRWFSKIGGGD